METNERLYADGFNNGYLIAKHEPELFGKLEKGIEAKNDYLEGFVSGGKEYEIEKSAPIKAYDKKASEKGKDIDRDR